MFTPVEFITDKDGFAKAKFKMTSDKTAILKAHAETKNVTGCNDLYTGSAIVKGIDGIPIKVVIQYVENVSQTVKRATLPGVYVEGGEQTDVTTASHSATLYHFPSAAQLKRGDLVYASKDDVVEGSKTQYVFDEGFYSFSKNIQSATIIAKVGNMASVQDVEKGSTSQYTATSSPGSHSEVIFSRGTATDSAMFVWNVEYQAEQDGEKFPVNIGMNIMKGDEGVKWVVKKVTDPKSHYKPEYTISVETNEAEEHRKGNKAMKDVFGVDLNELTRFIDPTKSKDDMSGAAGTRTIFVRIFSPFPDKR